MLNESQRSQLLRIARGSIEAVLDGRRPELDLAVLDDDLKRCSGSIEPVAPLAQAVASSAVNAAFRDPRFPPVQKAELADMHIEISVMSPIVPVDDIEEIEVGRDGLIVSRGGRAGLLLPQVATEYGWDRETFLRQTCVKAGLPPECWRSPDCRLEKFSAEVFGE
jgi:AmmeMemoRadiSam system protein A